MTAIDKLRELLDERGVHHVGDGETVRWIGRDGCVCRAYTRAYSRRADLCLDVAITYVPPERAIEATLGNDGVSERIKSFYLVMVADDLLEDGTPLCAYLDVPSAERRASRERSVDEDGVRHYAWVTEVKVVGE